MIEVEIPKEYEWILTKEGRAKQKLDIEKMTELLVQAHDIAEKYGFDMSVNIEAKG